MKWPGKALLFAASVSFALAACMVDRAPGAYATSVSYIARFERGDVEDLAGGGFGLTTREGLSIELRRGYLLQSSMTLVDCLGVGGDVWDGMSALFGPSIAYAGHGETSDPSEVIAPRFLDLANANGDTHFGSSTMPEQRYCRVHHLVAGSYDAASIADVPEDIDPVLTTLVLVGAVLEGGDWIEFDVRSTLSSGVLHDLPDVVEGDLAGSDATVVVRRDLARMFDGVSFDGASYDGASFDGEAAGRQVLRNLVIDADVRVTLSPPEES